MARDALAKFAIDRARGVIASDGDLELKDVRDNVAYIRYRAQKPADACAQCAVGPDDLKMFLQDIFQASAPHIKDLHIEFEDYSG
jgi:Fe-S cluster biogenesis protein NfuA